MAGRTHIRTHAAPLEDEIVELDIEVISVCCTAKKMSRPHRFNRSAFADQLIIDAELIEDEPNLPLTR